MCSQHESNILRRRSKKSGTALVTTLMVLMLMSVGGAAYIAAGTTNLRVANRQQFDIQTTHLCEAGVQDELQSLWLDFETNQNFTDLDNWCNSATTANPMSPMSGSINGVGDFAVAVVGYSKPDQYTRKLTLRSVGWIDSDSDGTLQAGDPQKVLDVTTTYSLSRSGVFDYTYFVNNYGWMDGFGPNDLIVNGDMRANGNFSITNGSPTINGSLIACANNKLVPAAQGVVNTPPLKWSDSTYASSAPSNPRWRQNYNASVDGAVGSTSYMANIPMLFESIGQIVNGMYTGALIQDSQGSRSWDLQSLNATPTVNWLDKTPSQELIMPDLSNLSTYSALSQSWTDPTQTYNDGTINPNFGKGAYVQTWNTSTSSYQTVTTNGVLSGSAALIGTSDHPILVHGPVTFTQDAVIKGNVSGQGTIYAGRNVHIVGSIIYNNPPNFTGGNATTTDNSNQKADMLGLAARGSIIMGDVSQFSNPYPLYYMEPPFTQGRYDNYGNYIPPFNAVAKDSTGFMLYQSVMGNNFIHSIASGVNQIDAVLYTNFVGGGDLGTGGGGVKMNGSIISKDEAMVVWSLPMYMNYDGRIRDRGPNQNPLIDINLPRSPQIAQTSWRDQGFFMGS